MTDTLTITLDDEQARAAFADLVNRATDMTGLMRQVSGHLADVAEEAFATHRAPDGSPWVDLSEHTKAQRSKRGAWPGQMLIDSGVLAASITTDYGRDFAQISSNVPYARIHHKGGRAGRGRKVTIPARPYLGVSPEAEKAIRDDMIAWVDLHRPAQS